MEKFIKVSNADGEFVVQVPIDKENKLSLFTLREYFQQAIGLRYNLGNESVYLRLEKGMFSLSETNLEDIHYYAQYEGHDEVIDTSIEDVRVNNEKEETNLINMLHISVQGSSNASKSKPKYKRKYKKRKGFNCDICERKFRYEKNMQRHKLTHSFPSFDCDLCKKVFVSATGLQTHQKKFHDNKEKVIEEDCSFEGINDITVSVIELESDEDNPLPQITKTKRETTRCSRCDVCGIRFDNVRNSLTNHQCFTNTDNPVTRQFTCEECKKSFAALAKLRLHLFKCHASVADNKKPKKRKYKKKFTNVPLHRKKQKSSRCKYANCDIQDEIFVVDEAKNWDTDDEKDEMSPFGSGRGGAGKSYVPTCDCMSQFSIVKYIEEKIPAEILQKFHYCQANNIPWTGFLGYSALYKFWMRIVTDNPIEEIECVSVGEEKVDWSLIESLVIEEDV